MTYRTRTLRMAAVERLAERHGREVEAGEVSAHDAWLLDRLACRNDWPEPVPDEPDPELRQLIADALEDGGRPEATPERVLPRVPLGVLIRER